MRHRTVCAMLIFGLSVTPSWGQLRLPDTGTSFLEDTKESAPENANERKKHKDDGKDAEAVAKATDVAGTTIKTTGSVVEFAGEHLGDAATAAQAGKVFAGAGNALGTAASGVKLLSAAKNGELATEVANQGAEKLVEGAGELMGGPLGAKVIGGSYKVTKTFLEDTKPGQALDKFRDETYLGIAGAYDAKPRTGETGPEAYEAQKLDRSMKGAGLIGPSETVPGFSGLNTGPDKRITSATTASVTSSGPSFDLTASARKAGINVDAPAPQKIVVNTAAVTKLLGLGTIPANVPSHDPAELQARLDSHVEDWEKKEDQRKADEAAELAYEAKEREEERREQVQRSAELDEWTRNRNQAIHDRVVARREAADQAYWDRQQALANAYQQRAAMAAAQMQAANQQWQGQQQILQSAQSGYNSVSGPSSAGSFAGASSYSPPASSDACTSESHAVADIQASRDSNGVCHFKLTAPTENSSGPASPSTDTSPSPSTDSTSK